MTGVSNKISESLREYLILTGWKHNNNSEDVSLEIKLGESITLQYPYMTARMQSVVGQEMAVAAGRQGILTCVPRSLRDVDKQSIIDANNNARLKKGDIEYTTKPEREDPDTPLEDVVNLVNKTGHSVIPILDRFSNLHGFYIHDPNNPPSVPPYTPIREVMTPLRSEGNRKGIPFTHNEDEKIVRQILTKENLNFLPIVDEEMVLQKLAFLQKYDTNFIGIAISTRQGWEEELEKWGDQVDTLMLDSSNVCFDDAKKILIAAKKKFQDKPFGIGNIIQGKHFKPFAEGGADYIIGGMGVGSICQTGSERGNGRGQATVMFDLAQARDEYAKHNRYVPLVLDGAISTPKDISVALTHMDFVMMGNYFNRFYEAPAIKFSDKERQNETTDEVNMHYVETWGEGHPRAILVAMFGMNFREALENPNQEDVAKVLERYGHGSVSSATIEGVVGIAEYKGRLKPCIEEDARYIKTTIANTGASNLDEFRNKKDILEKASPETIRDMYPHDIIITET